MNNRRLDKGIQYFNSGKYYEAHDVWEELWLALPTSPEKDLLKGLIMAAAALHHYKRKEYAGTSKLVKRGMEVLGGVKGISMRIDVEALLGDLALFLEKLKSSREMSGEEFPKIKERGQRHE